MLEMFDASKINYIISNSSDYRNARLYSNMRNICIKIVKEIIIICKYVAVIYDQTLSRFDFHFL